MLIAFNVNNDVSFMLNNKPIIKVDSVVHLGHRMGKNLMSITWSEFSC